MPSRATIAGRSASSAWVSGRRSSVMRSIASGLRARAVVARRARGPGLVARGARERRLDLGFDVDRHRVGIDRQEAAGLMTPQLRVVTVQAQQRVVCAL